jgi:hypothetical protein
MVECATVDVREKIRHTFSLIHFQMILVISSPSSSTIGLATLTFWKVAKLFLETNLDSILYLRYNYKVVTNIN